MAIKCISFDLDGTLAGEEFDKIIWNKEIPKLYAETHKVDLKTAEDRVFAEYYRSLFLEKIKNWTDIDMWFTRLGLTDHGRLMDDLSHEIKLYDDSVPALEALGKRYKLIIVSSAEKKFFDMKLEVTGLRRYFDVVISAPTDFGLWKKNAETFTAVAKRLGLKPDEILHVGNEYDHDFMAPKAAGMHALLLDRDGKSQGDHVITSLSEIEEKI